MINIRRLATRSSLTAVALAFGLALALPVFYGSSASAVPILPTNRSAAPNSSMINTNTTNANGVAYNPGDGGNGLKTKYTIKYNMTTNDATNMGSIAVMFCTTPFAGTTCTVPTGMTAANVTSGTVSGAAGSGWAIDTATVANTNYLNTAGCAATGVSPYRTLCTLFKASSASAQTAGNTVTVTVSSSVGASDYVTNPTSAGTIYVRIVTFSDTAYGSGNANNVNDEGAAAVAIISPTIDITSKVQEQLTFSVGITHTAPGSTCAALSGGGTLAIGDGNGALSTATPYGGKAYWRVYTNANNGTVIQYSADTLKTTTGYSITAAGTSAVTVANGVEKFGFGLDANDGNQVLSTFDRFPTSAAPDVYGGANSTSINTAAVALDTTSVSTPKNMAAQSTPGPISCATGANYYVASAATTTKPGIYKTSFTYIAVPTF